MNRKLLQKRSSSWLLAALCMAEQLWLCFFACAFLHMHHIPEEYHKTQDTLAIVPESICCCHGQNTGHEKRHSHNIPGPVIQAAEEDSNFHISGAEMLSGNSFCTANDAAVTNEMIYLQYVIDIPIIKKHNMRC